LSQERKGGVVAKSKDINLQVRFNKEWEEWMVKVFINGKYNEAQSYMASDRADAKSTALVMASDYLKKGHKVRIT
jgi:hypothetical protein